MKKGVKYTKKESGITMIGLVITIILLAIVAGILWVVVFKDGGLVDRAVQSRFVTDFKKVEEAVRIYVADKQAEQISNEYNGKTEKSTKSTNTVSNVTILPVTKEISKEEKDKIKKEIPTLSETIKIINNGKTIDQRTLYWIDLETLKLKMRHKYLIDVESMQLYDYEGEKFSGKMWHTMEVGINQRDNTDTNEDAEDEIWEGWIRLTLYYPEDSIERKWRLSEEGETRYDDNLEWEDYTGPITVRLSQVENIWIKYKVNGEEVIVPPLGKLLVDIEVTPSRSKTEKVKVKINYDKDAQTKLYRLNGGEWKNYEGEFELTENILIEAKGVKEEKVYDENGNEISSRKVTGKDAYFVRNIGTEENEQIDETLEAPTIQRLEADTSVEGEVARVKVIYPEKAVQKVYKENYGVEQEYTQEISIKRYGTEILAYYRTEEGKKSPVALITINEAESKNYWNKPGKYIPSNYGTEEIPSSTDVLDGPKINITNGDEEATIKITTAKVARKIYVQLGNGRYQEYTDPITVNQNMTVRAYYISEDEGETSRTSYARVTGIHKNGKPTVTINAEPYPYGSSNIRESVKVTIESSESEIQYSYDDIDYETYTGALTITENCRIYAKATNDKGTTIEYLDITNIGNTPPSKKTENLSVNISVDPEPSITTELINKAKVTIEYDSKASKKYYTIGRYGAKQEYTGEFEVTENCTIYAYALSDNGKGSTSKVIDNLTTGIAEPIIIGNPTNGKQSSKTKIEITFDKNAITKRYEINGGGLRDYTGEFEVTDNCEIRAVNTNSLGQTSEATYQVNNIVPEPPKLLLDKGDYYLLKLPFPEISANREYKYKENGTWKSYPEAGIILIKPEKKDAIIKDNKLIIQIEDQNGNKNKFEGDWYLLDVPISEIFENIYMRWDRSQPKQPTIILSTTEPARELTVTIKYEESLKKKEYNVVYPDGTRTGWKTYKEPIKVDRKNTVIYARGMDEAEVYTKETIKKITNIDEEAPEIKLTADLENAQQKVGVKVIVTDDVKVEQIKWAKELQGESYFETNGTAIENNSVIEIEENGYYTFYAEDGVGNKQTYTLNITNVDKTPPVIDIKVSPENTVGLSSTITIDYGDSTTKQYKIGENGSWKNYTKEITLTSNEVIAAKAVNEDYTVTIYAKGKDSAGNEIIVNKKILNLDLDVPRLPVINSNYGYPILTEYGVKYDGETSIEFDERRGITNLYSVDNGTTWNEYKGKFEITGTGTIIAKSVKESGLETIATKTITQPANALGAAAYDGNESTAVNANGGDAVDRYTTLYLNVSETMWNQNLNLKWKGSQVNSGSYASSMYFLDSSNTQIEVKQISGSSIVKNNYKIPEKTAKIKFVLHRYMNFSWGMIYEIRPFNDPVITTEKHYATLTEYGVDSGYIVAKIDYFPTSVQRLYKIGDGDWKNYQDKNIRLEFGEILYVKGINKNNVETITVSYTASLPSDTLGPLAYDGNESTAVNANGGDTVHRYTTLYLNVSETMWNQNLNLKWKGSQVNSGSYASSMYFLDSSNTQIGVKQISGSSIVKNNYKIPEKTVKIKFVLHRYMNFSWGMIYEIKPSDEPEIALVQNYYPLLTRDSVEYGYSMVNIKYFSTSKQRLYKIDDGNWMTYQNRNVMVEAGKTIYTKGIDKYGNESTIVTYKASLIGDALPKVCYNQNSGGVESIDLYNSNNSQHTTVYYLEVSNEMWNRQFNIEGTVGIYDYSPEYRGYLGISYLESDKETNINDTIWISERNINKNYTIPEKTKYIKISLKSMKAFNNGTYKAYLYEINPVK